MAWHAGLATILSMLGVAAASVPEPIPLQPAGQWLVEGYDNMCALSHDFGLGKDKVTVGLRPYPISPMSDVLLFTRSGGGDVRDGDATVQVDGRGLSEPSRYVSFALAKGDRRLLSFRIPSSALEGLAESKTLTLSLDRKRTIVIASSNFARGLAVLDQCQRLLRGQLAIDQAALARIAVPAHPIGSPSTWFSYHDYPDDAVRGGRPGRLAPVADDRQRWPDRSVCRLRQQRQRRDGQGSLREVHPARPIRAGDRRRRATRGRLSGAIGSLDDRLKRRTAKGGPSPDHPCLEVPSRSKSVTSDGAAKPPRRPALCESRDGFGYPTPH